MTVAAKSSQFTLPQSLPDRKLIKHLGTGGQGVVALYDNTSLRRPEAIKFLVAEKDISPQRRILFEKEAIAAARLEHPNIVPIYGSGVIEENQVPYLIYGYVEEGITLEDYQSKISGYHEAVRIIRALANALYYAHSAGVLHRDLSPSNILIDSSGKAFIADFGWAHVADLHSVRFKTVIAAIGTPGFQSPEQSNVARRGRGFLQCPTVDVHGLGALFFFLVTGEAPYARRGEMPFNLPSGTATPLSIHTLRPELPQSLRNIIQTCLHSDPTSRYRSCRLLANDLQDMDAGQVIQEKRVRWRDRFWTWYRFYPDYFSYGASAIGAILAAIGLWFIIVSYRGRLLREHIAQERRAIGNDLFPLVQRNIGKNAERLNQLKELAIRIQGIQQLSPNDPELLVYEGETKAQEALHLWANGEYEMSSHLYEEVAGIGAQLYDLILQKGPGEDLFLRQSYSTWTAVFRMLGANGAIATHGAEGKRLLPSAAKIKPDNMPKDYETISLGLRHLVLCYKYICSEAQSRKNQHLHRFVPQFALEVMKEIDAPNDAMLNILSYSITADIRFFLIKGLLEKGELIKAVQIADLLWDICGRDKIELPSGEMHYDLACVYSRSYAIAQNQIYADRVVAHLIKANQLGFRRNLIHQATGTISGTLLQSLQKDKDLDSVRDYPGFRQLIDSLKQ